jgi:hypothetical protein
MTKKEFTSTAKPLSVTVEGQILQAIAKKFSTGSVGWFLSGKVNVQLPNGDIEKLQVGGNLVIVGSKEWKELAA